ncbi:DUF3298 and DUF4163 domain-containing protein [Taibaiella lutea]|uniref:DUF3298 and DUF4163 domain-containing protein n=1 Tax=Taibaiella lutea TaxID=2608001 RepID=A0A5M6CET8_9BACT|nr:DUF3298 and DUF4163 domain-containing protein [Taibaiella lutea]KAA5533586.1 DUF3298 and DUF4163 domain-containing protein [Taibaiella lutea]
MKLSNRIISFIAALITVSIFSLSCGNNKSSNTNGTSIPTESAGENLSLDFYKRLEGTIANQPVVMHLHCYKGELQGTYYYVKQGKLITLTGTLDSLHPGNFRLKEYSDENESDNYPALDCVYESGQIKGSWRSADGKKSYLIELKEIYPQGSMKFSVLSLRQEIQAIPGVDSSPVATVNKSLIIPENDRAANEWLSVQIVKIINGDTLSKSNDIADAGKKLNAVFAKGYEADLKEAKADGFDISERFGYDDLLQLSILYNENDFLVIDNSFYSYTGGAHGFGGDSYYCFDVQHKKKLGIYDILSADSAQLQPIVEAAFRRDRHLGPTDSLNEILFENHLATTDNFYFTPTGIGFTYLPYEVASYADGSIFVFVPYSDLRKYIQPWFAERLKLN